MAMAAEHLSRLQQCILVELWAKAQRTWGPMAASHGDLVRALAHDKGNVFRCQHVGWGAKGLATRVALTGEAHADGDWRLDRASRPVTCLADGQAHGTRTERGV
jgi:hypothetical protein